MGALSEVTAIFYMVRVKCEFMTGTFSNYVSATRTFPVTFLESHPETFYKPVRDLKPGDQMVTGKIQD